jgi:FAD synthetase
MKEDAGERATKYLEATSLSFERLKMRRSESPLSSELLDRVLDLARSYEKDSKHYLSDNMPVTALACIAYAEGLLDALKFLQLAEF